MPVYAYRCTECATDTEVRQSFADDALTICETCGGRLRKRFDAIGVAFKGSGFYRTDSRASTSGDSSGGSGAGGSGASESASKSSDSKSSSSKSESSSSTGASSSSPSVSSSVSSSSS